MFANCFLNHFWRNYASCGYVHVVASLLIFCLLHLYEFANTFFVIVGLTLGTLELHVIDGIPQLIFSVQATLLRCLVSLLYHTLRTPKIGRLNYFLIASKTVEAEQISVDHVTHLKPSDGGSAATQRESFQSLFNHNPSSMTNLLTLISKFYDKLTYP